MSKITDSDPQKNLSIIKLKEISKDQEYAALMFFLTRFPDLLEKILIRKDPDPQYCRQLALISRDNTAVML